MSDSVTVTNMPDPGSKEAVAFKLWNILRTSSPDIEEQLTLYSKCLEATYRNGKFHVKAFSSR